MKLDYAERVIALVERNAILRIQGSYIGGIERFSDLCIQRLDLLIKGAMLITEKPQLTGCFAGTNDSSGRA